MDNDDKISELVSQFSADALPEEVKDIIPDFFMESVHISEQIETMGRFDYVTESVTEEELLNASSEANGETETEVEGVPELRSVLSNLDDIPDNLVQCDQVFDEYFRDGCGCNRKCHEKFPKFMAFEAHLDALDADQYCPDHINHQHLLLLGAMNALVQNHPTTIAKEHRPRDRKNARTQFRFRGQEVCRKFFLFVFGCGEKRIKNVMKQFLSSGISPKAHESAQAIKELFKCDPNHQRRDAVIFIRNYAQQHALQLPGRYMSSDKTSKDLYLLPAVANMTRKYIYDQYMICCRDLRKEGVSFALWGALWDWLCPNVMVPKNKYEICLECRQHQYTISRPEPLNDNRKLRSTEKYIHHLSQIHQELMYYKSMVESTRQALSVSRESGLSPASMHYTFDWYTSVSLPFQSRLSSIYFYNGYKVSLFGVCIEPLERFYLYIVPEFVIGNGDKLADITVSLIHHFFTNFTLNESQTYCHFGDNSIKQSKNNHILAYFMWRSVTGLNEKIVLSYMPLGHSRCWNDLFMGVFKKKFRNCDINSLEDIYQIGERCCGPANSITPILVGNDNQDIDFPLLDWNDKFSHINNLDASILNNNNHFEISNEVPGLVLCRRLVNSDTISYALIAAEDLDSISDDLPEDLEIEGISLERRKYLYDNIRQFTQTRYQGLICPNPENVSVTPNVIHFDGSGDHMPLHQKKSIFTTKNKRSAKNDKKGSVGESTTPKRRRAGPPKCSYCKSVGHRERIFGKTTCPKKKRDSLLLTGPVGLNTGSEANPQLLTDSPALLSTTIVRNFHLDDHNIDSHDSDLTTGVDNTESEPIDSKQNLDSINDNTILSEDN